jgi:formylglycine-generating enzyme required for sulfatase activity
MLAFDCVACRKRLAVPDDLAGRAVRCPACGAVVAAPRVAAAPAGSAQPEAADDCTPPRRKPGPGGQESLSDAEGPTAPGADDRGEATRSWPAEGPGPELTAFLAPPQAADELGRLGGFRILKVLGHGGMGVVYQGEDPRLGRPVAIKAMLPHVAGSRAGQERFLREARAAAALQHDHVVPIFHVGEDRGTPFLVMPFLQGEPLDARLKREKVLPLAEVLRIGREAAEGLAAAHERGLVHRDIKPGNLWLEAPAGRVKILDFGLARAAGEGEGLTQQGAVVGTPEYMAPEQAGGRAVDARSDLFSLGCVLYRLCSGELPFKGHGTLAVLSALALETPRPPREINPDVPAALSDLVMQLLAKGPEERPESARAVAGRLAALARERPPDATQPGTLTGLARRGRRVAVVAAVLLALLLAGVGLVFSLRARTGTLVLSLSEPDVDVLIDGEARPVGAGSRLARLELPPGEHQLTVKYGAEVLYQTPFTVESGAEVALAAPWTPRRHRNRLGMEFVLVPRGKSWLCGWGGKPGNREVEFKADFYMGKYEVTQEEWEKVMGKNPSHFSRIGAGKDAVKDVSEADLKRFPVEQASWDDAQVFIKRVNERAKEPGWVYRLPTLEEWEYACRGGPLPNREQSAFDFYIPEPRNFLLPEHANFRPEPNWGLQKTCKVGSYRPNRLGLYDMHGNVCEWCARGEATLPAVRGGCFYVRSEHCRAVGVVATEPSARDCGTGLRLARVRAGK